MSKHSAVKAAIDHKASQGFRHASSRIAADKVRVKSTAIANAGSPMSVLDSRLKKAARIAFHLMGED